MCGQSMVPLVSRNEVNCDRNAMKQETTGPENTTFIVVEPE